MAHPEVDLAGSVRTYSDAELMENRRRFILSIRAHKMRSFVRKERLIPRRKGTKLKSDKTEQAPFTRYDYSWNSTMYSGSPSPDQYDLYNKETGRPRE